GLSKLTTSTAPSYQDDAKSLVPSLAGNVLYRCAEQYSLPKGGRGSTNELSSAYGGELAYIQMRPSVSDGPAQPFANVSSLNITYCPSQLKVPECQKLN